MLSLLSVKRDKNILNSLSGDYSVNSTWALLWLQDSYADERYTQWKRVRGHRCAPLIRERKYHWGLWTILLYSQLWGYPMFFYRLSFYGDLFALMYLFFWKFVVNVPSCFSDWLSLSLSLSNLTVLSSKCFSFIIVCCSLVFSPPPKAVHKSIWISYSKHTTFWNNLDDCVKFYFELLLKHFGLISRFDQSQDTKCVYMHLKSLISVGLKQ